MPVLVLAIPRDWIRDDELVLLPGRDWFRYEHQCGGVACHRLALAAAIELKPRSPEILEGMWRIPSPVGNFEPDFVYLRHCNGRQLFGMLEIKGDIFWNGEGSKDRVKANAAIEWARANNAACPGTPWEIAVVLDQDAIDAASFEAMRAASVAQFPFPEEKTAGPQ